MEEELFSSLMACTLSGVTHLVFPGAVHSRFEHSIGVYHLAGEAVNELKRYQVGHLLVLLLLILHQKYLYQHVFVGFGAWHRKF